MVFASWHLETLRSLLSGHTVAELFCLFILFVCLFLLLSLQGHIQTAWILIGLSHAATLKNGGNATGAAVAVTLNITDPDSAHEVRDCSCLYYNASMVLSIEKVWAFLSHAR